MAEIIKHVDDSLYCIRHALRELPEGKSHGNADIDPTLSENNKSLLKGRCQTADEANAYRKELEKEIFKYNRKGLVRTIEIVIQCPDDCTQKDAFFDTSYKYVCEKVLPMGEKAVVTAVIHRDEHKFLKDKDGNFRLDENGQKIDISKEHLHIIAVPAVPDTKHDGYDWKLSAHDLTSRSRLHQFHPGLQKACDDAGIKATVYQKNKGDGKTIPLSVAQLKEITDKTGIVIQKSLTIDQLAEIISSHQEIQIRDKSLQRQLDLYEHKAATLSAAAATKEQTISELKAEIQKRDSEIEKLQSQVRSRDAEIIRSRASDMEADREKTDLKNQLEQKEAEKQQLIAKANQIIGQKNMQLENSAKQNEQLQEQLQSLQKELAQERDKNLLQSQSRSREAEVTLQENEQLKRDLEAANKRIQELEKEHERTPDRDQTWGNNDAWGTSKSWGDSSRTFEEDKTW